MFLSIRTPLMNLILAPWGPNVSEGDWINLDRTSISGRHGGALPAKEVTRSALREETIHLSSWIQILGSYRILWKIEAWMMIWMKGSYLAGACSEGRGCRAKVTGPSPFNPGPAERRRGNWQRGNIGKHPNIHQKILKFTQIHYSKRISVYLFNFHSMRYALVNWVAMVGKCKQTVSVAFSLHT